MKKKVIIIGYVRTGTHLIKEFYFQILKYKKSSIYKSKKNNIYVGLRRGDIFKYEKNSFFIYTPWRIKKFKKVSKETLEKINILSTHYFDKKLFKFFKNYHFYLVFRDPIDTISSIVSYVTKKNVLSYNKDYKIRDKFELIREKKLINKYIISYYNFYKNFKNINPNKITVINFESGISKLSKIHNLNEKKINFKISNLHKSDESIFIKKYLKKNFNFEKANRVYKNILKLQKL